VLRTHDGGSVTLDWAPEREGGAKLPATAPLVVLAHGLAGGSDENYIRSFVAIAQRVWGWRVVVYNRRGHGDTVLHMPKLTLEQAAAAEGREGSPREGLRRAPSSGLVGAGGLSRSGSLADLSAHGALGGAERLDGARGGCKRTWPRYGDTADFHEVVAHLAAEWPGAPLLAVGYSAGSNVLVKYLGEAGPDCPLAAAVSVSNAYDLVRGTKLFARHHPLWDWYMAYSLRGLAARHWDLLEQVISPLPRGLVRKASSVRDLDTLLAAPLYGYPSVDAYYADSHCCDVLRHVAVPCLMLNAVDDPVIHPSLLEYPVEAAAANGALLVAITRRGGHLGWLEGPWYRPQSWYERVLFEYLAAALEARETAAPAPAAAVAGAEAAAPPAEAVRPRRAAAARRRGAASLSPPPTASRRSTRARAAA